MNTIPQSQPSCLRVFAIPELAEIIYDMLPADDDSKLLLVCRSLFEYIRPIVWRETSAILELVTMIPDTEFTLQGDDILPPFTVLQLPSTISTFRLDIYAPFVKCLNIPIELQTDQFEGYENWDRFLQCVQSTSLLPNLDHIRVTRPEGFQSKLVPWNLLNWITAFMSPSVTSFCFCLDSLSLSNLDDSEFPWISLEQTHKLLQEFSKRCPQLDSLEIYPGDVDIDIQHKNLASDQVLVQVDFSPAPGIASIIPSFNNLSSLYTSPFIFDPDVFLAVARLPFLESLSIHGLRRDRSTYGASLVLPEDVFQALRCLKIWELDQASVVNLMHQRLLCRGLHTLEVHTFARAHSKPNLFCDLASLLAEYRSPITTLYLWGTESQSITGQTIEALKRLPLVGLQIGSLENDRSHFSHFLEAISLVEELYLYSDSCYSPMELQSIITLLPRLRQLSLNMRYGLGEGSHKLPLPAPSMDDLLLESYAELVEPKKESAEAIARFLYALKPNVRYKSVAPESENGWTRSDRENAEAMINEALSQLRGGQ